MRILLVTKGLDIGGVERTVVLLARGLKERGHHVSVAVVNSARDQLVPELSTTGVEVKLLRGTDRIGVRGAVDMARLVHRGDFDIVHVHGPLPAIVVRSIPGSPPVISTAHTPLVALHRLTRVMWRITARRDAAVIAVSPGVGASLSSRPRPEVIAHGVDPGSISDIRRELRGDGDPIRLIAVASHRPAKNYRNLLEAIRLVRLQQIDVQLDAFGAGPDLDENSRYARELGIADAVAFRPPQTAILAEIAAADILVVSSDHEGQPMVVTEALAVGTPVVATDVGHVAELVGIDVGRVVPTRDAAALATAIMELASSRELRARMGTAAERQSGSHTMSHVLDAHEQLYRRISRASTSSARTLAAAAGS